MSEALLTTLQLALFTGALGAMAWQLQHARRRARQTVPVRRTRTRMR
ncbi:hypothetical protein MARPU_05945 [Marichromatium purpuratum 984]|uniref:Uncharacterized protein n=1 Tax=Marichromatium purpuratum 984 TaxID=765910 RepID=W0E3U2_MARPU|nr:hypothetical protein [Marichromatium purpuratum]AHF05427.1 hypothetical protein MARPU_05945 [Marichromatium purpuratum 984]